MKTVSKSYNAFGSQLKRKNIFPNIFVQSYLFLAVCK